jgi:hypothetical protein
MCSSSLLVLRERLEQPLAGVIGNYTDSFLLADALAIEAVLAVLNVLENRLPVFSVPADDVDEAGFVAKAAADALRGIKFDVVLCEDRREHLLK